MAVLGSITVNEVLILEVDADPSVGGLAAPSGSIALMTNGSGIFHKGEGGDFDWVNHATVTQKITKEPTGFVNRTDSVISFNSATRVFTISPASGSYDVYIQGTKYTIDSAKTITLNNTTQPNFIYLDSSLTLQTSASFTPLLFTDYVYVAYALYNAQDSEAVVFAEERHGLTMDSATHRYLHTTRGTQLVSGGAISATTNGTGDANADAQIGISNLSIADEDIVIDITHSASPSQQFQQVLESPAQLPIFYRSGISGDWRKLAATSYPIKFGTSRAQYNLFNGSTWSLSDASAEDKYLVSFIFATNDVSTPVVAILGQAEYPNENDAEANATWVNLNFGTLPFQEFKLLHRIIYRTSSSYTNAVKSKVTKTTDYRFGTDRELSVTQQVSMTDHGSLSGLADDDHLQYLLTSGTRAMVGSLDMGGNAISNSGLINSVNITSHGSRHLPNGADALATGAASTIGLANSEGTANAFARQDHVHNHGAQTEPTHHAIATGSANGFMSSSDKTKLDGVEAGATAYSDEKAQDAVAGALTNTSTINFSYNDALNQISALVNDGSITNAKLASGIDAAKIGDGTVSTSEFGFLSNVTSDIQSQIDGKQATGNYITALTGDVTASGPGSVAATLANSGVVAGTYSLVTVDSKGRVTFGSNSGSITRYSYFTASPSVNSNATYTTVAELTTVSLPTGLYRVTFRGRAQSASTTNGMGVRISNGTSVVSTVSIAWSISQGANGVSQKFQYDQTAANANITSASVNAANTDLSITGDGVIRITSAGTLVLQFRSELNGTAATLLADSSLTLELL
jgi:hypothetical protein